MQSQGSETRGRLIQATIDLLIHRGPAGATFVDIAKQAGLSRGAMHHHFKDRTELFEAVLDHVAAAIHLAVKQRIDETLGDQRSLTAIVDFAWEQLNTREYLAYRQIREALGSSLLENERLAEKMRHINTAWAAAAANLRLDDSEANSELPRIVLAALLGGSIVMNTSGAPSHDPDFRRFRDQLKQLINLAEFSLPLDAAATSEPQRASEDQS